MHLLNRRVPFKRDVGEMDDKRKDLDSPKKKNNTKLLDAFFKIFSVMSIFVSIIFTIIFCCLFHWMLSSFSLSFSFFYGFLIGLGEVLKRIPKALQNCCCFFAFFLFILHTCSNVSRIASRLHFLISSVYASSLSFLSIFFS